MSTSPLLHAGQAVLVAPRIDEPAWRMLVDVVQDGRVTLASFDDEQLPTDWQQLREVHITSVDRFSVHLVHVPVVRVGSTRLVVGEPDPCIGVQRRAHARVPSPVPANCMLLEPAVHVWVPFDAEVRDLGGGGCALVSGTDAPVGAVVVVSFDLDEHGPIVVVGKVLPRETLPAVGRRLTRLEFVLVREADRDRILGFVLRALAAPRERARHI